MRQEQLTTAVGTRTVIGQPMGIIMGRDNVDEDRAFSFLKWTSQDGNIKLYEVPRQLVDQANQAAKGPASS